MSSAGTHVSWRSALESPTALRCGLLISDGISTVPLKLKRRDPNTGLREEAREHPLFDLLSNKPCDWLTSHQLRETLMLRTVFDGNAYAFVNRLNSGKIMEIWPFDRGEVTVKTGTEAGGRAPVYMVNGETVPLNKILHLRGPSWDSYNGLNMVNLANEVLGLADATQTAHASRFRNGIQTTGAYSISGSLNEEQHKRLAAYLEAKAGAQNNGKPLILDRDAKWLPLGMTGVDAEHLATRQHQDMLICRHYGVLPIMVGIADKTATYASAEQMFLAHAVHTIRPWHRRVGEILNCFLLTKQERMDGYYFHFVDTALLRGAARDRAEFYSKLFQVGGITPNQILGLEDMDGFEGGDHHYAPANMARIAEDGSLEGVGDTMDQGQSPDLNQPDPDLTDATDRRRMNAGRVLSGENEGLIRGARDDLDTVLSKLDGQQEI